MKKTEPERTPSTNFPNGILLSLFKQVDASRADPEKLTKNPPPINTLIAFGNFDRLCFIPVEDFSDYRRKSCIGHQWIGGRKDILLYALEESENSSERTFGFTTESNGSQKIGIYQHSKSELQKIERKFLSVSTFYVSGKAKNIGMDYSNLLNHVRKAITETIQLINRNRMSEGDKKRSEILFEVFGSVNPTELVILWASNQFTDIQYIVDQLRYLKIVLPFSEAHEKASEKCVSVFLSTYTIVALTGDSLDDTDVRGGGMIQLAGATGISENTSYYAADAYIRETIQRSCGNEPCRPDESNTDCTPEILHCAGEYDIIYSVSAAGLSALARENQNGTPAALNYKNPNFSSHFSSTTTRLFYQDEDVSDLRKLNLAGVMVLTPSENEFRKGPSASSCWDQLPTIFNGNDNDLARRDYLEYRDELTKRIKIPISTFLYNLDLLFCDYVQCVSTLPDLQWAKDYETQFRAAISVLKATIPDEEALLSKDANEILSEYIVIARKVIDILKQQIHHTSEAGKLSFEEPSTHSESTCQYDLIFHTFYGIVKSILEQVSTGSKKGIWTDAPTTLVPILRFSDDPIITSMLFTSESTLERKLVDIRIPYDACGEPGLYSPLLVHELFHYIPPINRSIRNEIFVKILATELFVDAIQKNLIEESENDLTGVALACLKVREIIAECFSDTSISDQLSCRGLKGTTWNDFIDEFCQWSMDSTAENGWPFGSLFVSILEHLSEELEKYLGNTSDSNQTSVILEKFFEKLHSELEAEHSAGKKTVLSEIAQNLLLNVENSLDEICQYLRELFPDYAMLRYARLEMSDYLLLLSVSQEKQYAAAKEMLDMQHLALRLGFAADYLLGKFKCSPEDLIVRFRNLEQSFFQKYKTYVNTVSYIRKHDKDDESDTIQSASNWFTCFENILQNYVRFFLSYRPLLAQLCSDQFVVPEPAPEQQPWKAIKEYFLQIGVTESTNKKMHHNTLFRMEIQIIHAAQPQKFLSEVSFSCDDREEMPGLIKIAKAKSIKYIVPRSYSVSDTNRFFQPIREATSKLLAQHKKVFPQEHRRPVFWYRGSRNAKFEMLPSIMRYFLKETDYLAFSHGENQYGTLAAFQRHCLERFKYLADGAPETLNLPAYRISDYIALMQHYSHPTCFLDWSEDVFSSLFFALEDFFPSGDKTKRREYAFDTAALYILDPLLYNRARKMLIDRFASDVMHQIDELSVELKTVISNEMQSSDVTVPNISVPYAEIRYGIHSLKMISQNGHPEKAIVAMKHPKEVTFADSYVHGDLWNLPLAINTSRLNPRIRAQIGNFLSYSIFSRPVYHEDGKSDIDVSSIDRFSYLSLLKIQEFFLNVFPAEGPFVSEILIKPGVKQEIADYLFNFGINKYRIYPELDNAKYDNNRVNE